MALRRARNVERTLDRVIFALMVEHMDLGGIGIDAAFLVLRETSSSQLSQRPRTTSTNSSATA
ncbi:hypothetical protein RHECNPAF_122100106 [Rhizobium etli CNPAF512]|nr:hypothetical protein RHECNPAF_122100106 [Rhizobium etli CNPAF512]